MGKFSLGTILFLCTYVAVMMASYRFLPDFTRLPDAYAELALSGCWLFATLATFIPTAVKQEFLSNRFWYAWVIVTTVGTWGGFWLLFRWCENEAKRSSQYPGLGGAMFLVVAWMLSGFISFVLGWFVPKHRLVRKSSPR